MKTHHIILIAAALILFGVVARLLPHAPNMTPLVALAFVGGLYLSKRWALILPGAVLLLSDAVIGFYDWKVLLSVYGSFLLIGVLSILVSKRKSLVPLSISVVSSSVLFFIITNTTVWAFSPWYEKTVAGLLYSYELGLPFFRNMLMGDVLYTVALVSLFEVSALAYRHRYKIQSAARATTSPSYRTTQQGR